MAISGLGPYYSSMYLYSGLLQNRQAGGARQAQNVQQAANVWGQKPAEPESPVQPVAPAPAVDPDGAGSASLELLLRRGADPVEMGVRLRVQMADAQGAQAAEQPVGAESVQKAAEEGRCETCEKRKYQDGSDDMGVSYQTPTRIAPELAASAVRGHEMEHVVREQAKAQREDRKVVSQSVTLHTEICPECGKAYISGGTTRTVTAADTQPEPAEQSGEDGRPFSAVA